MPAAPVASTLVFVLLIAAKYWFSNLSPARLTVSLPISPYACVPVCESPYRSWAESPGTGWKVDWGYKGTVRGQEVHASEMTQRSEEPVSVRGELSVRGTVHLKGERFLPRTTGVEIPPTVTRTVYVLAKKWS